MILCSECTLPVFNAPRGQETLCSSCREPSFRDNIWLARAFALGMAWQQVEEAAVQKGYLLGLRSASSFLSENHGYNR